jgi:hypothetical protein
MTLFRLRDVVQNMPLKQPERRSAEKLDVVKGLLLNISILPLIKTLTVSN